MCRLCALPAAQVIKHVWRKSDNVQSACAVLSASTIMTETFTKIQMHKNNLVHNNLLTFISSTDYLRQMIKIPTL